MALTEVVYKIRNDAFLLCQLTEKESDLKIIVNQLSWDPETGRSKALVTVLGPEDVKNEVKREAVNLYDEVEVVEETRDTTILKTTTTIRKMADTGNPVAFGLEHFSETALVEPAVIRDGYVNARIIVTGKVDLARMLSRYEEGVKAGRWNDFKLIRIDDYDPEHQISGAFTENLTQKQLEVIKTALALGFYNTPRKVTLDDLSNIFGISKAAVHNRLQAAERKVITKFFN